MSNRYKITIFLFNISLRFCLIAHYLLCPTTSCFISPPHSNNSKIKLISLIHHETAIAVKEIGQHHHQMGLLHLPYYLITMFLFVLYRQNE